MYLVLKEKNTNENKFKNKKALVGGSSKGLGYAVAKELAIVGP